MRSSPQSPGPSECPVCRADVSNANGFCGACGSRLLDDPGQEIRSLNYLLTELTRWEDDGVLDLDRSTGLRETYEHRREQLRQQLAASRRPTPKTPPTQTAPPSVEESSRKPHPPPAFDVSGRTPFRNAQTSPPGSRARIPPPSPRLPDVEKTRRALLERLADPHTIRLLLYTGAAMVVVGVVIWLRDILYLKLQEPVVQALLLLTGTAAVTIAGWWTILRTRLLLTGRALTVTGSLLVPVNFWFLVRSGLIENSGRAWLVCAFCAGLYALTAAFLRERLYVYLFSVATIATAWTVIYRLDPEAIGLYALSLMGLSIGFLHLAPLAHSSEESRLSAEIWRSPLIHVGLAGTSLSLLFYMPLRLGAPDLGEDILKFGVFDYSASVAMLLSVAGGYAAWFTGRFFFEKQRVLFFSMSALALFWTGFLVADGLRLSSTTQLLLLAVSTVLVALLARVLEEETWARALHHSSLLVGIALAPFAWAVLANGPFVTLLDGAILALLSATYAVSSDPRFGERIATVGLAYASAITASIAFLVALTSLEIESEPPFYAAWAFWPFVLYAVRMVTMRLGREVQLSGPFMRIADIEVLLLLLFAALVAFASNQARLSMEHLRGPMLVVLPIVATYGALRCWRDRRLLGAAIIPLSLFIAGLIILRIDPQWFAMAATLTLFPTYFLVGRYASERGLAWLQPSTTAADMILGFVSLVSVGQAFINLRVGEELLLAPCLALGAVALLCFAATLGARDQARVGYFRVGLFAFIVAFGLACLRAGFDPLGDLEIYTTPVAVILLVIAYLSVRRSAVAFRGDTSLLLWVGSLLFAGPLLLHALQYRLFLDMAAPLRDLTVLCAALALLIFGVVGRMRAPVLVGGTALGVELAALSLTTVDWLQIPLKVYLITTGVLILVIWGMLEFRREQILSMRNQLKERREMARERFGEWL